jgi:hypothetical protein
MNRAALGVALTALALVACEDEVSSPCGDRLCIPQDTGLIGSGELDVERMFPTDAVEAPGFAGCTFSSPLHFRDGDRDLVIVAPGSGDVSAIEPTSGEVVWTVNVPTPENEDPLLVATPVLVGDRLVVSYHTVRTPDGQTAGPRAHHVTERRIRHRVAVIDASAGALDGTFAPVDLTARLAVNDDAEIDFLANNALGRSALAHATTDDHPIGLVWITFGNARDIQPWHGWAFEISLDRWQNEGADAALNAVLVTTPESDCGEPGSSGSDDRICGGGLWAPSGNAIIPGDDGPEIIFAPGNGQLDLDRDDYANTMMRVRPGLEFDPGCDADLCADFDSDDPDPACIESCDRLFIPRLLPDQSIPTPHDGRCDGLTMFQCWEELDYIGGSTPAYVELASGTRVLAYPTKDGHVYLVDADHLGRMYDRAEVTATCGSDPSYPCVWGWAGMIITQPEVTTIDGDPAILVPSFMPDAKHPAGVVAFKVVEVDGAPKLERVWEAPEFGSSASRTMFRKHPTRAVIADHGGREVAWIADVSRDGGSAQLIGIEVATGTVIGSTYMAGQGMRFLQPLVIDDRIFVPSCDSDQGPSTLESYSVGGF